MKGLIIDEPWLSLILGGGKSWEMRSRHTAVRGRIALIRKGSGQIVGVADLVDSIGPLDAIAWRAHRERHRIPLDQQAATENWNVAWVLENVRRLVRPVHYSHPNGAVIWVNLSEDTLSSLEVDHGATRASPGADVERVATAIDAVVRSAPDVGVGTCEHLVPVARDGTWFASSLRRSGGYTIGPKGEEMVVADYREALAQLRQMPVARWRRPNPKGNWGIVSGVRWDSLDRLV